MTKISNQYSLTNILTADLANSRLGINNVSPTVALDVTGAGKFSGVVTLNSNEPLILNRANNTSTSNAIRFQTGGTTQWYVGSDYYLQSGTENFGFYNGSYKLTITPAGNVGIGTSSPSQKLHISGTAANNIFLMQDTTGYAIHQLTNTGGNFYFAIDSSAGGAFGSGAYFRHLYSNGAYPIVISTNDVERMRITSGGNVLIGTTTDNSFLLDVAANTTNFAAMVRNITSSACNGLYIYFPNSTSSTTSQAFLRGESAAGLKAMIYTNGSYGSATGTYGSIVSDLRLKENILEATSKLNDILRLRVVNFNITADLDKKKQIGFIAQEFKEVFPSLVFETDTREYDKNGNVIKGYENAMGLSVGMEFAILTKAIQELSAKVSLLENK